MPLVNPIISRVAPVKVGGSANAGLGFLASAFDHAHALVETAGPTNLNLGAWLDGEMGRRVGSNLVGRHVQTARLTTGPAVTASSSFADVGAQLTWDLKSGCDYLAFWFVYFQTEDTSTGVRLAVKFNGTMQAGSRAGAIAGTSPTTMTAGVGGLDDTSLTPASVGPGPVDMMAVVSCFLRTTSAAVLALRYRTGATSKSVTIQNGTCGLLIQG